MIRVNNVLIRFIPASAWIRGFIVYSSEIDQYTYIIISNNMDAEKNVVSSSSSAPQQPIIEHHSFQYVTTGIGTQSYCSAIWFLSY